QQPFSQYLEENVLRPLDMPNTTVNKTRIEADTTRAIGHSSLHLKRVALGTEIPYVGAGSVYTSANDLGRLIQLFLNWGTLDEQRLLDEEAIVAMYTPSAYHNYGLGLEIYKGAVGHGGAGLGFSSRVIWSPELEMGGLIFINRFDFSDFPQNLHEDHWHWLVGVLRAIRDKELIQKKGDSPPRPERHDPNTLNPYPQPDPNTFTPYQDSWKKYVGNYEYISTGGWELRNYAKIVVALGYNPDPIRVKEIDGYLCVDGELVDEYRPDLFFTASGDCLDFTDPTPTWGYHKIKKLKWVFP
ncbi:serine hydrolase domain-containing protein, partial [Planctomycetota bacterium]